jgi:hypothetical protein
MSVTRRLRLFAKGAGPALALTAILASGSPATAESFDQLPPGEQKIVRAVFEAQKTSPAPGSPTPLTLDQIAARKKAGKNGWGEAFQEMKAQGLVSEKSLGQVVSNYEQRHLTSGRMGGERSRGASGKPANEGEASTGRHSGIGSKPGGPGGGPGHGGGRGR